MFWTSRKEMSLVREKVAVVSSVLPPTWSGQSVVLHRLLSRISPERLVLISRQKYVEGSEGNNLPFLESPYYVADAMSHLVALMNRKRRVLPYARFLLNVSARRRGRQIARVIQKENVEALVACSGDFVDIPAAWWAARKCKIPLILYFFDDYEKQWWFSDQLRNCAGRWLRSIAPDVEAAICPCEPLAERMEGLGYNTRVIRNPYDSELASPSRDLRPPRTSKEPYKIVFTGAVYDLNLDAFENMVAALELTTHPVGLHIYTAQPAEQLRNMGLDSPHVHIYPHVPPQEACAIQQQADMVFLPFTFKESFQELVRTSATGKLADYLASGRPILAHVPSDSYVAQLLETERCGAVALQPDPKALAGRIDELLDHPEDLCDMAVRGVELARRDFCPDRMADVFGATVFAQPLER